MIAIVQVPSYQNHMTIDNPDCDWMMSHRPMRSELLSILSEGRQCLRQQQHECDSDQHNEGE